jgi:hypothetical protein
VAGEPSARGFLPVAAVGAEIAAVDGHGRPALVRRLGAGQTVLHLPARAHGRPEPARESRETWRIFDALATVAGVSRPVSVPDPRVLVGRVRHGAREAAIFVNCSSEHILVEPVVEHDAVHAELYAETFALQPFGVAVGPRARAAATRAAKVSRDQSPTTASVEGSDACGIR